MAKFAGSFPTVDCPRCGEPIPFRVNVKQADRQPTPGVIVCDVSLDEASVSALETHIRSHLA